ncbi:uncharacterized protein K452DRAFT_290900 [Aplosporella prunicola CBS 121167]|uniref:Uncharacterized protein n=1 Tax=Aplosporella prunicola CBS 121167 TaxID=1176127 RepID=A0A6A6B4J2_9PEZI|nr:uncharacterized protein K452DRAFT_290900 [Aplosporella prunicola CBS 121167]KAF2138313.1 hypothetical protein K452DRAFT_290900 [Aplosporella prunicola CBS 121167]
MPHHEAHANSQGVVGREDVFASAKIEPFEGHRSAMYKVEKSPGLDDEIVDSSRIDPLSEEM